MAPSIMRTGSAKARFRFGAGIGTLAVLVAGATAPMAGATESSDWFLENADVAVADVSDLSDANVTSPTGRWFVELAPAPTTKGGTKGAVDRADRAFRAEAAAKGVAVKVQRTFGTLWSGVSAEISDDDIATVEALPSVRAVYPVLRLNAPEPQSTSVPDMATAIALSGADVARSEMGLTGKGIKVGIIDTGVDTDHPDFGGGGVDDATAFPSEKIVAGYDFVGDSYNADPSSDAYQPVPQPDANPDDCQGHGTHVAGIVGANGEVKGVAPDVLLGAYRVFGCDGSTESDIMVAAMEQALADGMDVVNQSIGAAFQTWPQYPTAVASDNLVDAGVVMVASIGNSGASGTWSAGAPGVGEDVIGVASFDNTHVKAQMMLVDGTGYPFMPASEAPEPVPGESEALVALGTTGASTQACDVGGTGGANPIDPALVTGKAVLIQRGVCSFHEKAANAQEAGATAVVLYNNVPGMFSATVAGTPAITIPVVGVGNAEGLAMRTATADGATLTWTDELISAVNPTGGKISSFSSYGMTADLQLKPDLGAPGGNIWSTYPLEKGGYATLSGTSMSSPHVAGAVALLLEAKPDTEAHAVRAMLQNSADPATYSTTSFYDVVHRQGAGMLDIDDTIRATTSIVPGKLSLGESEHGPVTKTLTLTNDGAEDVVYTTSHKDGIATAGNPDAPSLYVPPSVVDMPETVTVPAGGSVEVEVTIAPVDGLDEVLAQYGGWLVFTPESGAPLSVPFAGFAGDYQDLELFGDLGTLPLPAMGVLLECDRFIGADCVAGGSYDLAPEGHTYTMADGDFPQVILHMEHPAEKLTIEVLRVDPKTGIASPFRSTAAYEEMHVGRDSGGISVRVWDGTMPTPNGKKRLVVPNGTYQLRVTALSPMGDPSNPEHVEVWTSTSFQIKRS